MKVFADGVEYSVRWGYKKIKVLYGPNADRAILEASRCTISKVIPNKTGKERFVVLGVGCATQKEGDIPNRNFARKLVLQRALEHFVSKDVRTAVWNTFLSRNQQTQTV